MHNPARDGIHGRDTISMQVDIGGLPALTFDAEGRLTSLRLPAVSLPIPALFNLLPIPLPGRGATLVRDLLEVYRKVEVHGLDVLKETENR